MTLPSASTSHDNECLARRWVAAYSLAPSLRTMRKRLPIRSAAFRERASADTEAASVVWSPNSLGVVVGGQVVFPVCEEELNATGLNARDKTSTAVLLPISRKNRVSAGSFSA